MEDITLGGGNTLNMRAIWRAQGIDLAFRKDCDQGLVFVDEELGQGVAVDDVSHSCFVQLKNGKVEVEMGETVLIKQWPQLRGGLQPASGL